MAPDPSADPQAGVETKELSVADLRAAARQAGVVLPDVDGPDVDPAEVDADAPDIEIDLVEAERQEAADGAGIERDPRADAADPAVPSWIDPRIRERRVAVTRAEGRRRLRILLTAVCVASAIGIAWLVVQSPLLAVDTINVRGTTQESQAAVRAAAGVHTGAALLFVDTGAVARRVEALPWVASAKVDRGLPNDLTITVVERAPVAWARQAVPKGSPRGTLGAVVLVDRSGRVLSAAAAAPPGFPELIGMTRVPGRGGTIEPAAPAAALAQLPDALRAQTASLTLDHDQAVLKLAAVSGGAIPAAGEVRLGDLEDVSAKGAAALAVLDQLAADGEDVHYIDVRVPGAPATR